MKRRNFVLTSIAASLGALSHVHGAPSVQPLPRRDRIRVAFMLGTNTNVIDTAGPWEVFQDVMVMKGSTHTNPFELATIGPSREPLTMTAGLKVTPRFTFADAPPANVVVVPAQGADDAARRWLKEYAADADLVMSVCTGAFQLARTGLLDGLAATTHHDFWDDFAREFPAVKLQRGPRFVDNGRIATAGGLTSGIDLALHVVERYFDRETALATARYMEHASPHWE